MTKFITDSKEDEKVVVKSTHAVFCFQERTVDVLNYLKSSSRFPIEP